MNKLKGVTVVIPCGGIGERLLPMTASLPKPLIPVFGRPVLNYVLDALFSQGFGDVVLSTGHGTEAIASFVAQQYPGREIRIHHANVAGTCGIFVDPAFPIESEDYLVVYADVLVLPNLVDLVKSHRQTGRGLALTAQPATMKSQPCSRIADDLSSVASVSRSSTGGSFWTYAPFAVLSRSTVELLRGRSWRQLDLVCDVVGAIGEAEVVVFPLDAPVVDIGEGAFAAGLLHAFQSRG